MNSRQQQVRNAYRAGEQAAQMALDFAQRRDAGFSERAYAFIVDFIRRNGPVPGELVTVACNEAGICPKDNRAFGAVYQRALRAGAIRVVGECARAFGHGSRGGKVYDRGVE